jgi:hypothetical protein
VAAVDADGDGWKDIFVGSQRSTSAGTVVNMVPALTSGNFNFGVGVQAPPYPYLTDLAAGLKASATTGALVVFIR